MVITRIATAAMVLGLLSSAGCKSSEPAEAKPEAAPTAKAGDAKTEEAPATAPLSSKPRLPPKSERKDLTNLAEFQPKAQEELKKQFGAIVELSKSPADGITKKADELHTAHVDAWIALGKERWKLDQGDRGVFDRQWHSFNAKTNVKMLGAEFAKTVKTLEEKSPDAAAKLNDLVTLTSAVRLDWVILNLPEDADRNELSTWIDANQGFRQPDTARILKRKQKRGPPPNVLKAMKARQEAAKDAKDKGGDGSKTKPVPPAAKKTTQPG